jgi:TPR repeat protein
MQSESDILYKKATEIMLDEKNERDPTEVFALLFAAAELGHSDAQVKVGMSFKLGEYAAQNLPKAAKYFYLAAIQNNADGLLELAKCYLDDPYKYNLEENSMDALSDQYYYEKKAFDLLKKSANQNHAGALYEIAIFLESGSGGLSDKKICRVGDGFDEERKEGFVTIEEQIQAKANKFLSRSAELGFLKAQSKVFWYYMTVQIGDSYDIEKITYWIQKTLENKDNDAQSLEFLGGKLYYEAYRIETIDFEKGESTSQVYFNEPYRSSFWTDRLYDFSLKAFIKSCKLGSKESARRAGLIYLLKKGGFQDSHEVLKYFKICEIKEYLAFCYARGIGCNLNYIKAVELLEDHCNEVNSSNTREDLSSALFELGSIYEKIYSVEKSFKSYECYSKGDSSQCLYKTGMCLLNGFGVDQDESKAIDFFMKSSRARPHTPIDSPYKFVSSGDRSCHGLYGMAFCFFEGKGVEQDYNTAFHMLSIAICRGKWCSNYICPSEMEVYAETLHLLGLIWEKGYISDVNYDYCILFYFEAAIRDNKKSLLNLANLIRLRSEGVIQFNFQYDNYLHDSNSNIEFAEELESIALSKVSFVDYFRNLTDNEYMNINSRLDDESLDGKISDITFEQLFK